MLSKPQPVAVHNTGFSRGVPPRVRAVLITPAYGELDLVRADGFGTHVRYLDKANLGIDSVRSVSQSWDVKAGEPLASVLVSVFQRTPDKSVTPAATATIQDPNVNAPLLARLQLPDGRSYRWRSIPERWHGRRKRCR